MKMRVFKNVSRLEAVKLPKRSTKNSSVGIIDADYYDNPENEGEIYFGFYNLSNETIVIEEGEKLGQGIFMSYHMTDDDFADGERVGGFGSTGE